MRACHTSLILLLNFFVPVISSTIQSPIKENSHHLFFKRELGYATGRCKKKQSCSAWATIVSNGDTIIVRKKGSGNSALQSWP